MRQRLVGTLFFWAAVFALRLVWAAPSSEEAPPAAPPTASPPPQAQQWRAASLRSGGDWGVYESDPANTRAAQRLGDATVVCLNDSSPGRCPPGATRYGYRGGAWKADLTEIPGSFWIWTPAARGDAPTEPGRFFFFSRTYELGAFPSGWIDVAADDAAEVRIDGRVVGSTGSVVDERQASHAQSRLTRFDLTPFLHPGANVITVGAANGPYACGARALACNPAGVVFGGALTSLF